MQTNQHYTQLIQDIKTSITKSRYVAARMVNQEQLKLYFNIGKLLDEKIAAQKALLPTSLKFNMKRIIFYQKLITEKLSLILKLIIYLKKKGLLMKKIYQNKLGNQIQYFEIK